ncbi:luc7-like protein 3 [Mercenaria mercenaria]|uniref:luc7-like protein 3 n=1 Tax=Mercenaria mercenaria TaxID=6596 RepID=UPI00234F8C61|nr:luc7-like protein 3 [Mercenaria mercenaria]
MGKSRAEIQRAYRERQKEKSKDEYLRKERERKRRSYVPSDQLSENDREERNRRNRANLREFYARKKAVRTRHVEARSGTSGYESNGSNGDDNSNRNEEERTSSSGGERSRGRLLVRLDFNNQSEGKRKAAIKRWKRDRSAANSRIRLLEQERDKLKTKLKTTQRSLQRLKEGRVTNQTVELTPSKQTEHDMNEANLNSEQKRKLRRSLLLSNVIASEIKATKNNTPRHKMKALHHIVAGRIAKKYKCIRYLSAKTGLGRRQLGKAIQKFINCIPTNVVANKSNTEKKSSAF